MSNNMSSWKFFYIHNYQLLIFALKRWKLCPKCQVNTSLVKLNLEEDNAFVNTGALDRTINTTFQSSSNKNYLTSSERNQLLDVISTCEYFTDIFQTEAHDYRNKCESLRKQLEEQRKSSLKLTHLSWIAAFLFFRPFEFSCVSLFGFLFIRRYYSRSWMTMISLFMYAASHLKYRMPIDVTMWTAC